MRFFTLIPFVALATLVSAHPGDHSASDHVARSIEMETAHLQARKCASAIAEFELQRRAAREPELLQKRATTTSSAAVPHYTTIQNSTCVTAKEVVEGPYYINNELVRNDLRETQSGVKLVLDIGVIDTTTCKPFTNALVELWAANATGAYGGYQSAGGVHKDTFLRGGQFTSTAGVVELTTIYPGFYSGRTAHIHVMVHKNIKTNANNTFVSSSGSLNHIGQIFFDETWNTKVYATSPYTLNKQSRTLNSQDSILKGAGNSAYASIKSLGSSLTADGLLGYITIAVDGSKSYSIQNKNAL